MLPINIENLCRLTIGWYMYIYNYIKFLASYFRDPSRCLAKFTGCQVGDNRRTVNTSTSPRISDQLGTENVRQTVMLIYRSAMSSCKWVFAKICIDMNVILDRSTGTLHCSCFQLRNRHDRTYQSWQSERHKDIIVGTHTWRVSGLETGNETQRNLQDSFTVHDP